MKVDLTSTADLNYKPNLRKVNELLDAWIVGEYESRMAVFTNWILAHQNVNLAGQRSSGKTWLTKNIARFLPEKRGLFTLSSGSEKSQYYMAEALKNNSHIMIPELNKLNKEAREVLKSWGEGVAAEYSTVVMENGSRRVQKLILDPKPFIFCLADEEEGRMDEQLRSRLTIVRTNISEEQNKAVMMHQALQVMNKTLKRDVDEEEMNRMRHHVSTLPPWDETEYKHPSASSFVEFIPAIFTDCRRDFPKYLKNTFGITRFHWKDRMKVKINKREYYLVTPGDMYLNHIIYGKTLLESSLKCSNMERQLIDIIQVGTAESFSVDKAYIQAQVRRVGMNISGRMIQNHLLELDDLGYIEAIHSSSRGAPNTYKVGGLFEEFAFKVDWNKVIKDSIKFMSEEYPDIAEEYIDRYCTNPTIIDPFTGEEVEIMKQSTSIETGESRQEENKPKQAWAGQPTLNVEEEGLQ